MEFSDDWIFDIIPLTDVRIEQALSQRQAEIPDDFILKTQQQIHKDFAKFNLDFPENFIFEPFSKEQIELAIQDNLAIIIKSGEIKLMQLLYTIDIPEEKFLQITQDSNFIHLLSEMILKREALKVYFRSKY